MLAPYSVSDVEKSASPGRGQLCAAVLDHANDLLPQRNLFDEHVMPHANTRELEAAAARLSYTVDQPSGVRPQTLPANAVIPFSTRVYAKAVYVY